MAPPDKPDNSDKIGYWLENPLHLTSAEIRMMVSIVVSKLLTDGLGPIAVAAEQIEQQGGSLEEDDPGLLEAYIAYSDIWNMVHLMIQFANFPDEQFLAAVKKEEVLERLAGIIEAVCPVLIRHGVQLPGVRFEDWIETLRSGVLQQQENGMGPAAVNLNKNRVVGGLPLKGAGLFRNDSGGQNGGAGFGGN